MRLTIATWLYVTLITNVTGQDLYEKSIAELKKGKLEKSLRLLNELLKEEPNNIKGYLLRADIFYSTGKFDQAVLDYDKIMSIEPANQTALKNRSLTKAKMGDFKGAIADIGKRIDLDPTNPKIYFDRAYFKGVSFDIEGSIKDYDKAIELNPNYKEAYANRGFAKINRLTTTGKIQPTKEDTADACADLKMAKQLGDNSVDDMLFVYCKE